MSDPVVVQEPYGLDDLEEDFGDEFILSEVAVVDDDLVEEVAAFDEGENDEDEGDGCENSVKSNDVGVGGNSSMEVNLGLEEVAMLRSRAFVGEDLDGCEVPGSERARGEGKREGRGVRFNFKKTDRREHSLERRCMD